MISNQRWHILCQMRYVLNSESMYRLENVLWWKWIKIYIFLWFHVNLSIWLGKDVLSGQFTFNFQSIWCSYFIGMSYNQSRPLHGHSQKLFCFFMGCLSLDNGHACVLVQIEGVHILTDPVFCSKLGPSMVFQIGPPHYQDAPCGFTKNTCSRHQPQSFDHIFLEF